MTSLRWLVVLASSMAFVLGAGLAWLWLAQQETTARIGYRSEALMHPKGIFHSPVEAAPDPAPLPVPGATVTEPSQAPLPHPRPAVAEEAHAHVSTNQTPQPAASPPQVAQAQQRRRSAAAQPPASQNVQPRRFSSEALVASRIRSWQRGGQWVVLVARSERQQAQRVEQIRQQLAPLVPHGLQLMVLSLPQRRERFLVLGPFPSEEAAGEVLWTLPTPFLLKQPEVMPAGALF